MARSTCTRTEAILRVLTRSDSAEGSVSLGGIFSVNKFTDIEASVCHYRVTIFQVIQQLSEIFPPNKSETNDMAPDGEMAISALNVL